MLIVDSCFHGHLVYVHPFFNAEFGLACQLANQVRDYQQRRLTMITSNAVSRTFVTLASRTTGP